MVLVLEDLSGLAQGISGFGSALGKGLLAAAKNRKAEKTALESRLKGISTGAASRAKEYPFISESGRIDDFRMLARRFAEQGYKDDDAYRMAAQSIRGSVPEQEEEGGGVGGLLQSLGGILQSPLTKALTASEQGKKFFQDYLGGASELVQERPGIAAASVPSGILAGIEGLAELNPMNIAAEELRRGEELRTGKEIRRGLAPSEAIRQAAGVQDLPASQQKGVATIETLAQVLPIFEGVAGAGASLVRKITGKLGAKAVKAGTTGAQEALNAFKAYKEQGGDLSKVASGDKTEVNRLWKFVNESEATPTTARVGRVMEETPKFDVESAASRRESQLSQFPKYSEEISADAAKVAQRLEKEAPKTPVGEEGIRLRKAAAEKELPKVEELYRNSIARLRSIEDSYVKASEAERKMLEPLRKAAREEYKNAEELLRRTHANAREGLSARKSPFENRDAAQKKTLKIREDILDGKDITISKADYNPEIISESNRIKKLKKQPEPTDKTDFHNQVLDEYDTVYKRRLKQVEDALAKKSTDIRDAAALKKEKGILEKLIEHTDAKKTIHNRNLALREISERKKASERFSKLKPQKSSGKVSKVAEEHFEKKLENPTNENISQAAEESGIPKEEVSETAKLAEDTKKTTQNPTEEAATSLRDRLKKWAEASNKYRKNPFVRAAVRVILKSAGLPVTLAAGVTGSSLTGLGYYVYNKINKEIKINKYANAIKNKKNSEIDRLSREYSPAVKKAGRKRAGVA